MTSRAIFCRGSNCVVALNSNVNNNEGDPPMTEVAKGFGSVCVACVTVAIAAVSIVSLAVIIWTQLF